MSISAESIYSEAIEKLNAGLQQNKGAELVEVLNQSLLNEFNKRVKAVGQQTKAVGYRVDIIRKRVEEALEAFKTFKEEFYNKLIATTKNRMNEIIAKHTRKTASAEEELLAFKRYETKVKGLSIKDLQKESEDFRVTGSGYTADQVFILAGELRSRGLADEADVLMTFAMERWHVEEPWRADLEWADLEGTLKALETYKAHEDVLYYKDDNFTAKIISLNTDYVMTMIM